MPAKFYVVDVPGQAILGLPTSERLELITINCNAMKYEPAARANARIADLKSVQDLKNAYPKQFDTLADFKHPAKLFVRKDARPFIDSPRKCPVHVKKKMGTDLFEIDGGTYLIMADYFSKFPVTIQTNKASSSTAAMETKKTLVLFGKPDIKVSDSGPQFTGKPYQDFMASWEIQHITSSPRYP